MKKVRIAIILLVGILVVSVLSFAMPTSTVPVAEANGGSTFTGHVFVDGMPVPCDTRIEVLQDGIVLGFTLTCIPCEVSSPPGQAGGILIPTPLDENEYCIIINNNFNRITIVEQARPKASEGTVNFRIGWDCGGGLVLLMAVETAMLDGLVEQDLHSSCPVGGIVEPVDLLELGAISGESSNGASASTFIAFGIGIAVLLAALIVWSVRRRRVA